jgi:hypothetical protein
MRAVARVVARQRRICCCLALICIASATLAVPSGAEEASAAKSRIASFCEFSYIPVHVTENGTDVLFLLAQPRGDSEMVVGRHFRVVGTDGAVHPFMSCGRFRDAVTQAGSNRGHTSAGGYAFRVSCLLVAEVQDWTGCRHERRQLASRTRFNHISGSPSTTTGEVAFGPR